MENTSARSRRTRRLSTNRVSPPVPGSTPSSGTSGSETAELPSSTSMDLVGGEGELVAAPGGGPGERRQVALPASRARVLDGEPGLVRELAEVHLEPVRGGGQHEDVGPGGKDAVEPAADHNHPDLGALEAEPLHCVRELDVHPEVVAVELQGVAGPEPGRLVHGESERGDPPLRFEAPMAVAGWMSLETDLGGATRPWAAANYPPDGVFRGATLRFRDEASRFPGRRHPPLPQSFG